MKALAGAVLIGFVGWAPARAADPALALFLTGRFAQAEAAGLAQNNAQGLAIAARSVLAEETMRDEPCLECLKHAEDLSRRAIDADPKQPEAHIYLAAAMGYESRIIGDIAAQSKGYASEVKRQLDAALASDPNDPWALAALGSWHIEIARSAGAALARWLYGARFSTGRDYYEKAIAAAPDNPVLRYQYALAISAFDLRDYREEAENELVRVIATKPSSAYETYVREHALQLLDALRSGDLADAKRIVRHDQGYPDAA